jgi:GNAT superfamily N-acetyltransferase
VAEATVRPAVPADVEEIARIQRDTWRAAYRDLLPEEILSGLDNVDAMRELVEAGTATVHVATEGEWIVGFCVVGPAPDSEVAEADGRLPEDAASTGLVATLLVEPRWGRRGHGGRLLAAAAETLRGLGATRGVSWVPEADRASLNFYHSAGWETDGVVRTLDAGGRPFREARVTGPVDLKLISS